MEARTQNYSANFGSGPRRSLKKTDIFCSRVRYWIF